MRNVLKIVASVVIAGFCIVNICKANDAEVVGIWIEEGQVERAQYIEIFSDRTVTIKATDMQMTGTWTILTDGRIKMDVSYLWAKLTIMGKMQGANLLLDMDGRPAKFVKTSRESIRSATSETGNISRRNATPGTISGKQFSPTNLLETLRWADNVKANLLAVSKQGNAIIYREAQDDVEKQIADIIGSKIRWLFHVASVEEDGMVKFAEAFDTQSFAAPILAMEQGLTIYFSDTPSFSPQSLRALRAGDGVEIQATIKDAALQEDILGATPGINIVLNGITAPAFTSAPTMQQEEEQSNTDPAKSLNVAGHNPGVTAHRQKMATVAIKNGTINLLGIGGVTSVMSIFVDDQGPFSLKPGEQISDTLAVGSSHSMRASMNGKTLTNTFTVGDEGGTIVLMPSHFQ